MSRALEVEGSAKVDVCSPSQNGAPVGETHTPQAVTPPQVKRMQQIRCTACNRLLAEAYIADGVLAIKCKCGRKTVLTITTK